MSFEEILSDRKSGSMQLLRSFLQILPQLSDRFPEVTATMENRFPDMAVVRNGIWLLREWEWEGMGCGEMVQRMEMLLRSYDEQLVELTSKAVHPSDTLLTISNSGTLTHVLGRIKFAKLYIMESLPGGEGRLLHEVLRYRGNVELISDEEASEVNADHTIVSCDSICPGVGFVNKVGTRAICVRPTLVLGSELKLVDDIEKVSSPALEFIPWREDFRALIATFRPS